MKRVRNRRNVTYGNITQYIYAADGRKLREKHTTAVEGLHMSMGQTFNLLQSQKHRFLAERSRKIKCFSKLTSHFTVTA